PAPGREATRRGSPRVLASGQASLGPGRALDRVDFQLAHVLQVEHDAAIREAVTGHAVPAAADGELDAGIAGQRDDVRNLSRIRGPDDGERAAVEAAVEGGPGLVVLGVIRRDQAFVEARAQL